MLAYIIIFSEKNNCFSNEELIWLQTNSRFGLEVNQVVYDCVFGMVNIKHLTVR